VDPDIKRRNDEKARLYDLDRKRMDNQYWLGELEERHGLERRRLAPRDGHPPDQLTRLEQLVMHNEVRLRSLSLDNGRIALELRSADPGDRSARLDSLDEMIQNHEDWINILR
jgi:hypothetical protein